MPTTGCRWQSDNILLPAGPSHWQGCQLKGSAGKTGYAPMPVRACQWHGVNEKNDEQTKNIYERLSKKEILGIRARICESLIPRIRESVNERRTRSCQS